MPILQCPECKEEFAEHERFCPNCELEMTPGKIALAKSKRQEQVGAVGLIIGGIILSIVVVLFGIFVFGNTNIDGGEATKMKKRKDISEFWPLVEKAVKKKLDAGPTVDLHFPADGATKYSEEIEKNLYKVNAYVDRTGLDANDGTRQNFSCLVEKLTKEDGWKVRDLIVSSKRYPISQAKEKKE